MSDAVNTVEVAVNDIEQASRFFIYGYYRGILGKGGGEANNWAAKMKFPSWLRRTLTAIINKHFVKPVCLDTIYPLKAAEMMADKMVDFHGCPAEIGWTSCEHRAASIYDECEKDQGYCWLQYFRERAEEGEK